MMSNNKKAEDYTLKDYGASILVSWFPSPYQVISDFLEKLEPVLLERAVFEILLGEIEDG